MYLLLELALRDYFHAFQIMLRMVINIHLHAFFVVCYEMPSVRFLLSEYFGELSRLSLCLVPVGLLLLARLRCVLQGVMSVVRAASSHYSILLTFVAGYLARFAFAPNSYTLLIWLSLIWVAQAVLAERSAMRAGLQWAVWWLALALRSFCWVVHSMHRYGHLPMWQSWLMLVVAGMVLALVPWLFGQIVWHARQRWRWLNKNRGFMSYAVLWPVAWLVMEKILSLYGECGWMQVAYALAENRLRIIASLVGVDGLSFLLVQCAAILAWSMQASAPGGVLQTDAQRYRGRYFVPAAIHLCLLLLLAYAGLLSHPQHNSQHSDAQLEIKERALPIETRIVNLNIQPDVKWDAARKGETIKQYIDYSILRDDSNLATYKQMWNLQAMLNGTRPFEVQSEHLIVVWPESAYAGVLDYSDQTVQQLRRRLMAHKTALITGSLLLSEGGISNGMVVLGCGSGEYRKRRLLPFGEYLPARNSWFGRLASRWWTMGDLVPGPAKQPLLVVGSLKLAPVICSEIAYTHLLLDYMPEADAIVGIADDSWFEGEEDTGAGAQHRAVARMRAIEYGRCLIWANNSGYSLIMDSDGSVREGTGSFSSLQASIYRSRFNTPYCKWRLWVRKMVRQCCGWYVR